MALKGLQSLAAGYMLNTQVQVLHYFLFMNISPPEPLLTAILYIVVSISTRLSDAKGVINDHLKLLNTAVRNLSQAQMRFSSRDNLKVTL